MAEEYKVDDINTLLNTYLASAARKRAHIFNPIVLRAEFKTLPAVSDASKNVFEIDMSQLISFRENFVDKKYKYIRLHQWEFHITYENRKPKAIELNAQHAVLIVSKTDKKQLRDCCFSITVKNAGELEKLNKANQGFLNRLTKRNLIVMSEYVAEEHFSLLQFVKKPLTFNAVEKIGMPTGKRAQEIAMSYLSTKGIQMLQKLRNFISRDDLLSFVVTQELSSEGEREMRRLIISDVLGQNKRKGGYDRSIIEALQKNLHD